MKASELKDKTIEELQKLKQELLTEQFNLRMQRGSNAGALTKNHLFKQVRRNIARVETLITQKTKEGASA